MKYLKIYEEYSGTKRKIASGYGWKIYKDENGMYYFCNDMNSEYIEYDVVLESIYC